MNMAYGILQFYEWGSEVALLQLVEANFIFPLPVADLFELKLLVLADHQGGGRAGPGMSGPTFSCLALRLHLRNKQSNK